MLGSLPPSSRAEFLSKMFECVDPELPSDAATLLSMASAVGLVSHISEELSAAQRARLALVQDSVAVQPLLCSTVCEYGRGYTSSGTCAGAATLGPEAMLARARALASCELSRLGAFLPGTLQMRGLAWVEAATAVETARLHRAVLSDMGTIASASTGKPGGSACCA